MARGIESTLEACQVSENSKIPARTFVGNRGKALLDILEVLLVVIADQKRSEYPRSCMRRLSAAAFDLFFERAADWRGRLVNNSLFIKKKEQKEKFSLQQLPSTS